MKPIPRFLLPVLAACSAVTLHAQSTWNGATDQNWATAGNWSPSGVPADGSALLFGSASGYTVDLGGVTRLVGAVTFNSSSAYTLNGGGLLSFAAGTGITQDGSGSITIDSNVTFGGTAARSITGSGAGSITFNGVVTRSSGTLTIAGPNEIILGGSATNAFGSASINVGGASGGNATTLTLAKTSSAAQNAATGTGTISLSNGTLKIVNSDATLANGLQIGSGNGTLETDRLVTLNGNLTSNASRTLTLNNTQKFTVNGDVTSSGSSINSTRTFMLAGSGDADFNGDMYDSAANKPLAITKTNTGTFRFNGTNTYTGATLASAGVLLINGTNSGQGSFTVNDTGALGGTGTIGLAAAATVSMTSASAVLAPGDGGAGTLTIDGGGSNATAGLILNAGTLVFDLGSLSSDKIVLTNFAAGSGGGASTAGEGGLLFTFNGAADYSGKVYELIEFASAPGIALDRFALSAASLGAGWDGTFGYDGNTLTFTAVPEARTNALLILAGGVLAAFGARRRKAAIQN